MIGFLGDTHVGVRNDSDIFLQFQKRFFVEFFFPELKRLGIKTFVQLGDLFDRRQYINFKTLHFFLSYFPDLLKEYDVQMVLFLGNHDVALKSSNHINSPEMLLSHIPNITVVTECTDYVIHDGGKSFTLGIVPWINNSNYEQVMNYLNTTKASVIAGHFEISGFEMHKGHLCDTGMDSSIFKKFELVVSGHFHTKGAKGNILYTGVPYEMSWSDWNDEKGFWTLDTATLDMNMHANPYKLFHKITYQNTLNGQETVTCEPPTDTIENKYVKVLCVQKEDDYLFDKYIKSLMLQNPLDLQTTVYLSYEELDETQKPTTDVLGKSVKDLIIEKVGSVCVKQYNDEVKNLTTNLLLELHAELNTVS